MFRVFRLAARRAVCPSRPAETFRLGNLDAHVTFKRIRHVILRVRPDGSVHLSAPLRMPLEAVREFALSKTDWIQKQLRAFPAERPPRYETGEKHPLWGRDLVLTVGTGRARSTVKREGERLLLKAAAPGGEAQRRRALDAFYRREVAREASTLIEKWRAVMGVRPGRLFVRRMKTRWGTCHVARGDIRLNSELAKKPPECLEYVVVHELAHLLERHHNARFRQIMDRFLPGWRGVKSSLDRRGAPRDGGAHDE